jgi:hypothetical protein
VLVEYKDTTTVNECIENSDEFLFRDSLAVVFVCWKGSKGVASDLLILRACIPFYK